MGGVPRSIVDDQSGFGLRFVRHRLVLLRQVDPDAANCIMIAEI
jgi:hypothetical protein